jgi:hypothetical protein
VRWPSGVGSPCGILAGIEQINVGNLPPAPIFRRRIRGCPARAIHVPSVDPARNSPQPSMQMSTVGRRYRNGVGGLALKSLLVGSVPSTRPRSMPGRAQGAGLSELAGSQQRVPRNVPFARRRSAPENGARHFSCPRAPKKSADVEATKSMTCVEKPGPTQWKMALLAFEKAPFPPFLPCPFRAPASPGPGLRTASGAKGKRGGPYCCAMMSALSKWILRPRRSTRSCPRIVSAQGCLIRRRMVNYCRPSGQSWRRDGALPS